MGYTWYVWYVDNVYNMYTGWWFQPPTPLKNMTSSVGMMTFLIYGKNKNHVPNHQPEVGLEAISPQKKVGLEDQMLGPKVECCFCQRRP